MSNIAIENTEFNHYSPVFVTPPDVHKWYFINSWYFLDSIMDIHKSVMDNYKLTVYYEYVYA